MFVNEIKALIYVPIKYFASREIILSNEESYCNQ